MGGAFNILNKTQFQRNKYKLKDDRHTLTAMMVTKKSFDDINDYDRQIGKSTRHAGNLGIGKHMYMLKCAGKGIFMSEWKCGKLIEKFHAANSQIKQIFHKDIQDGLAANNFVSYILRMVDEEYL